MKVFYLAHPIKGDNVRTTEENLAHILVLQKLLLDAGIFAVAPYWTFVHFLGSGHDFPNFQDFLNADYECARKIGRIILSGHKLSSGMRFELTAVENEAGEIIDLVGIPDDEILPHLMFPGEKNETDDSIHRSGGSPHVDRLL